MKKFITVVAVALFTIGYSQETPKKSCCSDKAKKECSIKDKKECANKDKKECKAEAKNEKKL